MLITISIGISQEATKIDSVAIQAKMAEVMAEINALDAQVEKWLVQRNKEAHFYNGLAEMLVPLKVEEEAEEEKK